MKTASFLCGLLFAIGLGLAGMTQPSKVIGFLDIFGKWDPSLIFVMGGALVTHAIAYRWIRRRSSPILAADFRIPPPSKVSPKLLVGAMLFGVGWGLAGYCPAPVLVALASLKHEPFLFVGAMLVGMLSVAVLNRSIKNTSS